MTIAIRRPALGYAATVATGGRPMVDRDRSEGDPGRSRASGASACPDAPRAARRPLASSGPRRDAFEPLAAARTPLQPENHSYFITAQIQAEGPQALATPQSRRDPRPSRSLPIRRDHGPTWRSLRHQPPHRLHLPAEGRPPVPPPDHGRRQGRQVHRPVQLRPIPCGCR